MLQWLNNLLSSDFMPHGHCYLWDPTLVWLEVLTHMSIGVAYLSISITLAYLVGKIRDLPFGRVYIAFGVVIITCGFTHFMDVVVIWRPLYWLDATIRAVTAVASVGTAVLIVLLVPRAVAVASAAHLAMERGAELARLNEDLAALYANTRSTLAEAIPQMVWTTTPDGLVDYVNHRWVDYTGERSLGWAWITCTHPEDQRRIASVWQASLASGDTYEIEYRLRSKEGAYRWFLVRGLPLRSDKGIVKWFGTCTDVHDQKVLVEEREALLTRAQEEVRARDVFLAIAAHELKTPLTPLRLEVERILHAAKAKRVDRLAPEALAARMGVMERQIERLEHLIGNLLDVTRLTTGQFELRREDLDLGALVAEVVNRHRVDPALSGSSVSTHLAPAITGRFDRLRLDQVITNLLTNAIAYGQGQPITIDLTADDAAATLVVADRGPGIAPEDRARIFERFERATSERHGGGIGLGLWLVRQIVEAHGGTVTVESAPGQGSRFIVRLPRS